MESGRLPKQVINWQANATEQRLESLRKNWTALPLETRFKGYLHVMGGSSRADRH